MPVAFLDQFQLIHLASNKYLEASNSEAENERENRKYPIPNNSRCCLADFPSDRTTFYLSPVYKHQVDRKSHAYFGEEVFINPTSKYIK